MTTVVDAAVVFVLLLFIVRVMGKRELAEMSAFDLVILFLIGDLTADAVISEDNSLTGAAVAVSTFVLLTVALSWLSFRSRRFLLAIDGAPKVVVRDGRADDDAMRRERLSREDLNEAARANGIRSIDDIELAVLEPDGGFSFFVRKSAD